MTRPQAGLPNRGTGFTYLGLLFFVAITAAALAALGQMWSTAAQREREAELEFRGNEIARAIQAYVRASQTLSRQAAQTPGAAPLPAQAYPRSLEDLLIDARGPKPRHHLRQAYRDPFTGEPDWVLVPAPGAPGRFNAVHSRADTPLLRTTLPDGSTAAKASDWVFNALPQGGDPGLLIAAPRAASAASAATPQ